MKFCYQKNKTDEFTNYVKSETLGAKNKIINNSKDHDDCISNMEDYIDDKAEDFVLKDNLLKEIPEDKVNTIKDQLRPIFSKAYVKLYILDLDIEF